MEFFQSTMPTFMEASFTRRSRHTTTQQEVIAVFSNLQKSTADDIARALAFISKGFPNMPTNFVSYAKRTMHAFQTEDYGVVKLQKIEVKGDLAMKMQYQLLVADHWEDVVSALDLSRPKNNGLGRSDEDEDKPDTKPNYEELTSLVALKNGTRRVLTAVVKEMNEFEKWARRTSGLKASYNAKLAYDVMRPFLQLAAEAAEDFNWPQFVTRLVESATVVRPDFTVPAITFSDSVNQDGGDQGGEQGEDDKDGEQGGD
eukprot:m.8297 g.8297  ORF g.8297 m.8297 type:complete len:258 (-) comp3866_c0_seq1:138-911(-)